MKIFPLLLASIALAGVESARSPLQISGTTISHATTDGNCHVPKSFGKPSGYQLTTNGGSCDLFWSAPGGAFVDSARVAGLADSAKAAHTLQQTYNASTAPQITTSVTKGALTIRRGSASDPDAVLSVQDGSGVQTAYIAGNGAVAGAQVNVSSATANTLARFDAAKYLTSYALVAGDIPALPYLPLAAGSGSPLTGVLYGTGLNFTSTADAPISISHNLAGGFTHPFQAFNSGMVAGNQYNFDFGQSASTNNAANFGFKYVGAGLSTNYVTLGMYGANDRLTVDAAGTTKAAGNIYSAGAYRDSGNIIAGRAAIGSSVYGSGGAAWFGHTGLNDAGGTGMIVSPAGQVWLAAKSGQTATIYGGTANISVGTEISASAKITMPSARVSDLTASKFVKTDASKNLISTDVAYSDLTGTVPTWNQSTTGNAASATKWATARNLTIGSSTQALDGTTALTFSLAAIGAQVAGNYLPVNNPTFTGVLNGPVVDITGAGSGTVGAGPYVGTRSGSSAGWLLQLGASNTWDLWNLTSSTWTKQGYFLPGGNLVMNGAVLAGNAAMAGWSPSPGYAWFGANNQNQNTSGNSGFLQQNSSGHIYMCAPSGTQAEIQVSGATILSASSTGVTLPGLAAATTRVATINAAGQIGAGEVASTTPQAFGSNINLSSVTSRTLYPTASGLSITIPTSGVTLGQTFKLSTNAYSVTILCPGVTVYYAGTTFTSGSSITNSVMVDIVCLSATVWAIGIN